MNGQNLSLPGLDGDRDLSKSQWYTPPWLAEQMWQWWLSRQVGHALRVLEPSAGNGSLVRPVLASARVELVRAFELDRRNVALLRNLARNPGCTLGVRHDDFLAAPVVSRNFDVALMNPPYEGGQDVAFILRALAWAPVVVGVFRSALVHGDERYEDLWRWVDITRAKSLRNRPCFGTGDKSESARSDFVVLELVMRPTARIFGEDMQMIYGWW